MYTFSHWHPWTALPSRYPPFTQACLCFMILFLRTPHYSFSIIIQIGISLNERFMWWIQTRGKSLVALKRVLNSNQLMVTIMYFKQNLSLSLITLLRFVLFLARMMLKSVWRINFFNEICLHYYLLVNLIAISPLSLSAYQFVFKVSFFLESLEKK